MNKKISVDLLTSIILVSIILPFSSAFEVGVNYSQNYICTPNQVSCLDVHTLATCNSLGTDYDSKVSCSAGSLCVVASNGSANCISPQNKTSDGGIFLLVFLLLLLTTVAYFILKKRKQS